MQRYYKNISHYNSYHDIKKMNSLECSQGYQTIENHSKTHDIYLLTIDFKNTNTSHKHKDFVQKYFEQLSLKIDYMMLGTYAEVYREFSGSQIIMYPDDAIQSKYRGFLLIPHAYSASFEMNCIKSKSRYFSRTLNKEIDSVKLHNDIYKSYNGAYTFISYTMSPVENIKIAFQSCVKYLRRNSNNAILDDLVIYAGTTERRKEQH